jgi:hypothetical protein
LDINKFNALNQVDPCLVIIKAKVDAPFQEKIFFFGFMITGKISSRLKASNSIMSTIDSFGKSSWITLSVALRSGECCLKYNVGHD